MLFGPGCDLSLITVRRLTWQRWSVRAVGCACAFAVAIGWEQARTRRGVVRMVGRGFNWIDWLFLFFGKALFNQNIIQIDFPSCKREERP